MKSRTRKNRIHFVFTLPALLFLLVFSIVPMLYSFRMSFYNYHLARPRMDFVGLDNYLKAVTNADFLNAVGWTFSFTVIVVVLNIVLALALAVLLTGRFSERYTGVFKTMFTLPMMIAPIVIATIWKFMFSPIYGVINGTLTMFGLDRVNWLSEAFPARAAIIFVELWATIPLCMLILIAALKTVPDDLYEAATVDGANGRQMFFRITLPVIRNFIVLVATFRFMDAIRMFDIVYNLTNGGPGTATETLASTVYKMTFRYMNVGEGSAMAFIFMLIIMLCSWLLMKMGRSEKHA
mgnify:CR=1 FL=1|jgi:multiple sugar transport system permease protein